MQDHLLLVMIVGLGATLIVVYIWKYLARRQFLRNRKDINLDDIFEAHFNHIDKRTFYHAWAGLADALRIPPEKMLLSDTISNFVSKRHLPEADFERIEEYFMKIGIAFSEVNVNMSVGELIEKIVNKTKFE